MPITSLERHNRPDGLRLPHLFFLLLFWGQLTSQSHSSLLLLFGFVFFLVLYHLELHDFDVPFLHVRILPEIGVRRIELVFFWSTDLVDVTVGTTDQNVCVS